MLSLLVVFCLVCQGGSTPSDTKDLHLLGILPVTGDAWPGGRAMLVAMEMAIEQVNSRTDVLAGYKLNLTWVDGKCMVGHSLYHMFKALWTPPTKIMIVGLGCSIACMPCSESAALLNLTVMSGGCTGDDLALRERFPNFFRTVQPGKTSNPVRIALMDLYGWNKISFIQHSYDWFIRKVDDFISLLTSNNKTVLMRETYQDDASMEVGNLKNADARIIMSSAYQDKQSIVVCNAYESGLYGSNVVWMFPLWLEPDWYTGGPCAPEQFLEVIDGALYIGDGFKNPILETSIGGINGDEFDVEFLKRSNGKPLYGQLFAPPTYDSIWATALALNATVQKMQEKGFNKTLDEFTYADQDIQQLIIESIYEVEFLGIAGHYHFKGTGNPSGFHVINQQHGKDIVLVAIYYHDTPTEKAHWMWMNGGILWRGGHPPKDGIVTVIKQDKISPGLFITLCVLAGLGVVMATLFLGFNVTYRDRKLIKMSSPKINNIILLGCVLSYFTVFFRSSNLGLTLAFCIVRQFLFVCGFAMTFGSLFAKTWRVHVIMITSVKTAKKKVIHDYQLVLAVLVLVLIDILILVLWHIIDPYHTEMVFSKEEVSAVDPDIVYKYEMQQCHSEYSMYFTGVLLAIQGLLLIVGAFLAWETRTVRLEAMNDSKFIGMCVYNVAVLAILGVAINYVVEADINISYAFTSSFIIAGTTLVQTILFVPKVWSVMRSGNAVAPSTTSAKPSTSTRMT